MKLRCFMLVVGVILVLGITSCNSDDFESIVPEGQKELSTSSALITPWLSYLTAKNWKVAR